LSPEQLYALDSLTHILTRTLHSVAIFSAIRLFSIAQHRAGTAPVVDLAYYSPPIFIFSSLEIQVAMIYASTPVFWPLLESINLGKIFVM
jgi:hypothetical protein